MESETFFHFYSTLEINFEFHLNRTMCCVHSEVYHCTGSLNGITKYTCRLCLASHNFSMSGYHIHLSDC